MKKFFPAIALWACVVSVHAQAVPDTIYIYETITVYDTIVIRDTVRIKRAMNMPAVQPKNIDAAIFLPTTDVLSTLPVTAALSTPPVTANFFSPPAATFSENSIIYHENTNQKDVNTMNMNVNKRFNWNWNLTNYLSATILTAQSMTGMLAQETNPAEKEALTYTPAQFSIAYPMTTMGGQSVNHRYALSFNLFSGKVGAVRGVEFGAVYNQTLHDVRGVQFCGIANKTRELTGVQFGGITNISTTLDGIQFGGIANVAESAKGIQFAGIANFADTISGIQFGGIANLCNDVKGIQFGGIANVAKNVKGIQFAGIANVADSVAGIQFAGIGNISRELSGISFGGIYNRTGTLRGIQFGGIVNVIDTIESGVSISLVNIVRNGAYKEWSLAFADYMNVGISYKFGIQKFYLILSAGANFMEDRLWVTGVGFGNRTAISPRFDIQPEIIGYHYFPSNFRNFGNESSTHLKCGFIWKLNDILGISIAPSIYHFNANTSKMRRVSSIPPIFEFDRVNRYNTVRNSFGMGISMGITCCVSKTR